MCPARAREPREEFRHGQVLHTIQNLLQTINMKKFFILSMLLAAGTMAFAQTDTIPDQKADTIRVGGIIIIKKGKPKDISISNDTTDIKRKRPRNPNLKTNWFIVDLGFNNYVDNSNYTQAAAEGFVAPGVGEDQFDLRNGKSVNVNIWFFMQKLNISKHFVNLKYGLGLELYNFRYRENLLFETSPTHAILDTDRKYKKNKLAADYLTVPVMLDFNFTPKKKRPFGMSVGVSGGYLYSSRQKTNTYEDGQHKNRDDFNLRPFKLAYVGEVALGPVRLYGTYASRSMFDKGLDQTPYAIGFRISDL